MILPGWFRTRPIYDHRCHGQPYGITQRKSNDQYSEIWQYNGCYYSFMFMGMGTELNKGDNIVLAAFGGGFTWGATLVKWAY